MFYLSITDKAKIETLESGTLESSVSHCVDLHT